MLHSLDLKVTKIAENNTPAVTWVVPTLQEAKEAYIRLSFKFHPDKPGGD